MGKSRRFLSKLQVNAEQGLAIAAAMAIAFMMVITTVDVVMRKVLAAPIKGSYEFVEMSFVAAVFFGLAYAQYRDEHISIGVLYDRLSPRFQRPTEGLVILLSLAIFALITWASATGALWAWKKGDTILGAMPVLTWPARAAIPVGTGMLCLRLLVQFWRLVMGRKEEAG